VQVHLADGPSSLLHRIVKVDSRQYGVGAEFDSLREEVLFILDLVVLSHLSDVSKQLPV
jgi:hypothetical protein